MNVDPGDLLSPTLADRLRRWDESFQSTYEVKYPPDGGFQSDVALDRFNREGEALRELVEGELGVTVSFHALTRTPLD